MDGHHVTEKQKGSVRLQMCNDYRNKFIANLYNVLLAPDLCNRIFSIITLMNAGHTCLSHRGFCTMYFGAKDNNALALLHSAQKNILVQEKSRMCQRKINLQQERKFIYNC